MFSAWDNKFATTSILAFKYATSSMPGHFIAVLFIKAFGQMRVLPDILRMCLKTIPLTLTLLFPLAPGAHETFPPVKRQALNSAGP